jgi:hypothetical protein
MVSSRVASSLSCPARLPESWRLVSSTLAELADSSWLAVATFRMPVSFSTFNS